jgi:kumamolisin
MSYHAREGELSAPADVADRVLAVLGLDTSPVATPKFVPHRGTPPLSGFLPTDVAALYGVGALDAADQCIGIIELAVATRTRTMPRHSQPWACPSRRSWRSE